MDSGSGADAGAGQLERGWGGDGSGVIAPGVADGAADDDDAHESSEGEAKEWGEDARQAARESG
jgi:hypothetical protein